MSGVKGMGKANGNSLRHGGKSLVALVQRSQDPSHPVLRIITAKAEGYMLDRGGMGALSTMQQDTLRHGAVLAILADLHVHRILNDRGRPRRMNAARFRDLALAYSRIVEAHARLLAVVGIERAERELPDLARALQDASQGGRNEQDA